MFLLSLANITIMCIKWGKEVKLISARAAKKVKERNFFLKNECKTVLPLEIIQNTT